MVPLLPPSGTGMGLCNPLKNPEQYLELGGGLAQGERLRPKRRGTKSFYNRSALSTLIDYNLITLINCNQALVFLILIESK